jgi:uncharacterized OB-fold protein
MMEGRMEQKRQSPVKKGLWEESVEGEPRLIGDSCENCGELFFPKRKNGICLRCQHMNLRTVLLSRIGKISSFTVVMIHPAGGIYIGSVPYAYGCVDLPEGVRIKSRLTAENLDVLRVGMDVETFVEKIGEDEGGIEIMTFAFRPVSIGR